MSEKVVFSKDTCRTNRNGREGWKGRGGKSTASEMGEIVETVLGWGMEYRCSLPFTLM